MKANGMNPGAEGKSAYEAPTIERLGLFHVETQSCFLGKQWGGHDSWSGIVGVPISNCSA